jgi:hypothetical protein
MTRLEPSLQPKKTGVPKVELTRRYSNHAIELQKLQITLDKMTQRPPIAQPSEHRQRHKIAQRLDPDTITAIVKAYEDGTPTTRLTLQFNLGKGTVLRILQAHRVTMRNQPLTPEQVAEAVELYLQGWSKAKVGRHFHREHTVIRDVLKRVGITRRDTHGRPRP